MGTKSIINERNTQINSLKNQNRNISKINQIKKSYQTLNDYKNIIFKKTQETTRFSTIFQWDGEAVCVYLTGSFCDWHQFFQMEKSQKQKNKFFLILFLPKGVYQYKFKIDDKWKCNSNFPTCSDKNGNVNNILDLTKIKKEDEKYTEFSSSFITKGEPSINNDEIKLDINEKNLNESYIEFLPDKKEIKEMPQKSPLLYNIYFNFDFLSCQKKIGLNLFLQCKEQNILNENYSYKKILPLHEEQIDHFNVNKNILNKNGQNLPLVLASTFRYRYKLMTYIYYKPSKNEN